MADKKVPSEKELKVVEQKEKKEGGTWTVKRVLTTIIIAILAMLMVGSAYYIVILIQQGKSEKKAAYGFYDGEPIALEYNNVFYNTLMNDQNFQNAYVSGDISSLFSSYYAGFRSQAVYTALSKLAKQAGITAIPELVNRAVIKSGIYNGEDGKFSEDVYNKTDSGAKTLTMEYAKKIYPYNVVLQDVVSSVSGSKEADFVSKMSSDCRDFEYFVVDYNAYPDSDATVYGEEHSDSYRKLVVSQLIFQSAEKANSAYSDLIGGSTWDSVAEAGKADGAYEYKDQTYTYKDFVSVLKNAEDAEKVVKTDVASFTEPIEATSGMWTIIRLDEKVSDPDFTDKAVLSSVKQDIFKESKDLVTPFIESAKDAASVLAQKNFTSASDMYGAQLIKVPSATNNIGNSSLLTGFSYSDFGRYLSSAASSDAEFSKQLFTSDKDTVLGPVAVNDAYIIVRVADTKASDMFGMEQNIKDNYDAVSAGMLEGEAQAAVLSSDKMQDNFMTQFLTTVMGQAVETK